jgi:hypothetical protein
MVYANVKKYCWYVKFTCQLFSPTHNIYIGHICSPWMLLVSCDANNLLALSGCVMTFVRDEKLETGYIIVYALTQYGSIYIILI